MGVIIVSIFTVIDQAKVEFLIHSAEIFGALNRIISEMSEYIYQHY